MPSARQVTWAKIRIFMVTLAALSILSVLVYLLSGGTWFEEKSNLYLYIPDATGLSEGSLVRVNGIDVGKIEEVSLSGTNQPGRIVKIRLRIEQRYLADIPADSYAQLETDTALGDKYVNITRGRSRATTPPFAEVAFRAQPELLKTLDLEQFTQQLRSMSALLDQIEQGKNLTGQLLLSDQLYNQIRQAIVNFERDTRVLVNPQNPVGKMLYKDDLYRRIHEPLLRLDQAIAAIQNGQNPLGKLVHDDTQYNQLTNQLAELRHSIENVQANAFLKSDEMYTGWSRELASLVESVDQINASPLLSSSEVYDNLTGFAAELRDNVHDFREDPRKFLRIKMF